MRKALTYGAVLIGMYLVGAKATNWGRLLDKGSSFLSKGVIRPLQGR